MNCINDNFYHQSFPIIQEEREPAIRPEPSSETSDLEDKCHFDASHAFFKSSIEDGSSAAILDETIIPRDASSTIHEITKSSIQKS